MLDEMFGQSVSKVLETWIIRVDDTARVNTLCWAQWRCSCRWRYEIVCIFTFQVWIGHFHFINIIDKSRININAEWLLTFCRSVGIESIVFSWANLKMSWIALAVAILLQVVSDITVQARFSTINTKAIPSKCILCRGRSIAIAVSRSNIVIVVVVVMDDVIRYYYWIMETHVANWLRRVKRIVAINMDTITYIVNGQTKKIICTHPEKFTVQVLTNTLKIFHVYWIGLWESIFSLLVSSGSRSKEMKYT